MSWLLQYSNSRSEAFLLVWLLIIQMSEKLLKIEIYSDTLFSALDQKE